MIKVGGEVDAFCAKCQLTLAHTVHAVVAGKPVKLECNTCHAVHRNRGGHAAARGANGARPARAKAETVSFEALLGSKRAAEAKPYSPKRAYAVDDVIDHPMFGRGFVSAVHGGGKIEVTFRSDVKLLVHDRA